MSIPATPSVLAGEYHTALLLRLIERSPLWKDSVVIVTDDDNGGLWDHARRRPSSIGGDPERVCRRSSFRHSPNAAMSITLSTTRQRFRN